LSKKVYITGIGIITAIGHSVEENFISLRDEKAGIGKMNMIDSIYKDEIPVGEVNLTDDDLIDILGVNKEDTYTRTALLGLKAAKEALEQSGITDINELKTGIISATTVAGMSSSELYYEDFLNTDLSNEFIKTHEAADSTEKIAEHLGIREFMTTISTACSSSANALMQGARMIKHGYLDRVIAGGTDALSKFTLNGFNTLMILDRKACRPFDFSREGLNLGEGAAYLILESEDAVKKGHKKILAELTGYANANDAHHQTASSPDGKGPFLAMSNALKEAGLKPGDISYINVHGTGTSNNDLTEGIAMNRLFENKVPRFSSTKSYTGHTLAAAGAVEAVFSILSLQHQMVFPNLRFKKAIEETGLVPVKKTERNIELKHILSNSFGFGGNGTSIIVSKV
jgi:3-oxoacyl-[acyl-carrier-protein] synthase II